MRANTIKVVDISKKRKPKTVVWLQQGDKDISFYQVWIYPYAKMQTGARVCYFRANKEKKLICHVYLEEDFKPDPASDVPEYDQWEPFLDNICKIARKALAKEGVDIKKNYPVYIEHGLLNYSDLDEED